jgi:hypothetical protein
MAIHINELVLRTVHGIFHVDCFKCRTCDVRLRSGNCSYVDVDGNNASIAFQATNSAFKVNISSVLHIGRLVISRLIDKSFSTIPVIKRRPLLATNKNTDTTSIVFVFRLRRRRRRRHLETMRSG